MEVAQIVGNSRLDLTEVGRFRKSSVVKKLLGRFEFGNGALER
uniref:Uncharacterized protein n=1 Tax=Candidozyma auris TaxID=498019 RepID=A0A0L0P064_CANAR